MTQAHKTPGAKIVFKAKVFEAPYAPFYDEYRDVVFEVIDPNVHPGHMKIKNMTTGQNTICHDDEVQTLR